MNHSLIQSEKEINDLENIRSYLKNRKMVRSQGRRKDLKNPDHRSGILLMKKPVRLFQVIRGIYVNILRITIQAGRRNRAI